MAGDLDIFKFILLGQYTTQANNKKGISAWRCPVGVGHSTSDWPTEHRGWTMTHHESVIESRLMIPTLGAHYFGAEDTQKSDYAALCKWPLFLFCNRPVVVFQVLTRKRQNREVASTLRDSSGKRRTREWEHDYVSIVTYRQEATFTRDVRRRQLLRVTAWACDENDEVRNFCFASQCREI